MNRLLLLIPLTLSALPETALASTGAPLNLTGHWVGYLAIAIFIIAYALVMAEDVAPSNTGAGYVVRRLIRRSIATVVTRGFDKH